MNVERNQIWERYGDGRRIKIIAVVDRELASIISMDTKRQSKINFNSLHKNYRQVETCTTPPSKKHSPADEEGSDSSSATSTETPTPQPQSTPRPEPGSATPATPQDGSISTGSISTPTLCEDTLTTFRGALSSHIPGTPMAG